MDDLGELLQGSIKNRLKYELYLSKNPDEQLVTRYGEHVASLVKADEDVGMKDILKLKKHAHQNLLYGCIKFDQNIEEEWFIIYLLFELSKYDQDLVIKVHDSDGDILLIEAAEHLPPWLESSKSKNRAFIHKGHLHIIPEKINLKELLSNYKSSLSCSSNNTVTLTQVATRYIRETNGFGQSGNTLAHSTIQNAIREQLCCMPDKKEWLSRKLQQLDEIISDDKVSDDAKSLDKKFRESLSLASVMAMNDDDLRISPFSSAPSSVASSLSAASSFDSSIGDE